MYENLALSDNGFLFDTRTGSTFSLSHTGTFLLRQLISGTPPEALPGHLMETFDIDSRATATRDVEQFMLRLKDLQLSQDAPHTAQPSSQRLGEAR